MTDETQTEETQTETSTQTQKEDLPGLKRRLSEVSAAKNEWKSKAEAALTQVEPLQARLAELEKQTSRYGMEKVLWQNDFDYDDDVLDLLDMRYSKVKVEEGSEKPPFDAWLAEHAKSSSVLKRKNRASATETHSEPKKVETARTQTTVAQTVQPPPANPELTQDQIMALSPKQYAEYRKTHMK